MPERCRNVDGVHIPGCMGCAALDHSYCTCDSPSSIRDRRVARLAQRVRRLEQQIAALTPTLTPAEGR